MADIILNPRSPHARALSGWPSSPGVKPTCKIEIDNKYARDMEAAWVQLRGNQLHDLTGKYITPINNGVTRIVAGSLEFDGATDGVEYDERKAAAGSTTVIVRFKANKALAYRPLITMRYGSTPFNQWQLGLNGYVNSAGAVITASGAVSSFSTNATSPHSNAYISINFSDDEYHTVVAVLKDGSNHKLFFDGAELSATKTGNFVASAAHNANQHTEIFHTADALGGSALDGICESAFIINRAVTDDEARRISVAPYNTLLKPANQTPVLVSLPAGGGAVDITPANATHAHTVAAPSLTQAHSIVPADGLHSHAVEQSSLTQANSIGPSDALHAHTADQTILVQLSVIAPAGALHDHAADQANITQAHVLAVVSATHAHIADNSTLTVGGALAPADALHGHLSDEPSLVQAGTLQPEDATHGHAADQPTLTQEHSLAPSGSSHAHTAGQPTLDLSVVISADGGEHAHSAESPAITQLGIIAVADAVHAHLADQAALTQAHTIIASDALHAHMAASPALIFGTLETPSGRVFLVRADSRVFLVN